MTDTMTTTGATGTTGTETGRLERAACGRCGGTGHYSYCQMYGTTCFGCQGRKVVFTKRGAEAARYLKALRSRKAAELKVGDTFKASHGWEKVVEVRAHDPARDGGRVVDGKVVACGLTITGSKCRYIMVGEEATYEVLLTKDEQAATLAAALAYQDTLTKAGTPRKARAKAGA